MKDRIKLHVLSSGKGAVISSEIETSTEIAINRPLFSGKGAVISSEIETCKHVLWSVAAAQWQGSGDLV